MIGIDLVYIPSFTDLIATGGETFLKKAFNSSEMRNQEPDHLAGLWAAKEAIMKATGASVGEWLDIVITHQASGKPTAEFRGQVVDISISHDGEYAVAVAQVRS
jgi:holo-[acyl-carrier protein] synthase